MKIKVVYFASMREQAGKTQELYETEAKTPQELFYELNEEYEFSLKQDLLKVAVNETYVDFSFQLTNMDTVVFIPPVAGG